MPEIKDNFDNFDVDENRGFEKSNLAEGEKNKKSLPSRGKLFVVFGIVALIVVGALAWSLYLNPEARESRGMKKNWERMIEFDKDWKKQLSEDAYGGRTPGETLNLFIEALRNEDLELASKYFMPEIDEGNPGKITWQSHLKYLQWIKERGFIQRLANDLENYNDKDRFSESRFIFFYYNDDGSIGLSVPISLNRYSGVWKIEKFY